MKRIYLMSAVVVMGVLGMAIGVDARSQSEFSHGCGTGCAVKVKRISDVKSMRLPSGQQVKNATFVQQQFINGQLKTSSQRQFFADCQQRQLASADQNSIPKQKDWNQLAGDDSDYTTVAGGRGFYFDALCK
ncbi:hypothetical protein NG798_08690 [Ancylothrix sp. C2]|nr:hypothetical protein [Ancylothrix sp. D3o]